MAEGNKAIVRSLVEEVWNKGNLAVVDEIIADDYIHHGASHEIPPGPEGYKQTVSMNRSPFLDFQMILEDLIAEGDKVAGRWTIRGTHQGELMGIAPTGRQVAFTGIFIVRIAGRKVAEEWEEADALGLMQQLRAVPTAGR